MFMDRKTQYCQISVVLSLIYKLNAIPIKIPASCVVDIYKQILNFIWRVKRPRLANTILMENKVGGLTLIDFKTYYIAIVIKILCSQQRTDI